MNNNVIEFNIYIYIDQNTYYTMNYLLFMKSEVLGIWN